MKMKSEVIRLYFDVEINYSDESGRQAAINEARVYFKKVSSSQGYFIDQHIKGKLAEEAQDDK